MDLIDRMRVQRLVRQSRYRPQLDEIPPGLFPFWQRSSKHAFPGMPTNRVFFIHAATGLMRFFALSAYRRQPCALPSLAADSVWHAWLAWDAEKLTDFCRSHFGKPIMHLQKTELDALALPRALVGCRELEGMRSPGRGLPALFGLDARLRMPLGHGYSVQEREIFYCRLDAKGEGAGRARQHPDLTLQALLLASLISEAAYAEALRDREAADGGGGVSGGGDGGDIDSDAGGGDSGDSGGSCGGGCGGGD